MDLRGINKFLRVSCVIVLVVNGLHCSNYDGIYDCFMMHICNCSLIDEYEACWKMSPDGATEKYYTYINACFETNFKLDQCRKRATDGIDEFYPGLDMMNNLKEFEKNLCHSTREKTYPAFKTIFEDMEEYEKELSTNAMKAKDNFKLQRAKVCLDPFIMRCLQMENDC